MGISPMTDDEYRKQSLAVDSWRMTKTDRPGLTIGTILRTAIAGLAIWAAGMGLGWVILNNV